MITIAISNEKGGVGKTTTAVNLCYELQNKDARVVLIDLDAQANASRLMLPDYEDEIKRINDVSRIFYEDWLATELCHETAYVDLDVIPSSPQHFNDANMHMVMSYSAPQQYHLANALKSLEADYDFVILDCPPKIDLITMNAYIAADYVIVPVQDSEFSLSALSSVLTAIKNARNFQSGHLCQLLGCLRTMTDKRLKSAQEMCETLKSLDIPVLETEIRRSTVADQAVNARMPIGAYDPQSKIADDYRQLADEIMGRIA